MADLSQRLFRLSAELGDLHLKRRIFERQRAAIDNQLAQGDALIAAKEHEIEVVRQLRAEEKAEADAAKNALPTMPDVPEPCAHDGMILDSYPPICGQCGARLGVFTRPEGAPDAAPPAPVDAAPDRPAPAT